MKNYLVRPNRVFWRPRTDDGFRASCTVALCPLSRSRFTSRPEDGGPAGRWNGNGMQPHDGTRRTCDKDCKRKHRGRNRYNTSCKTVGSDYGATPMSQRSLKSRWWRIEYPLNETNSQKAARRSAARVNDGLRRDDENDALNGRTIDGKSDGQNGQSYKRKRTTG